MTDAGPIWKLLPPTEPPTVAGVMNLSFPSPAFGCTANTTTRLLTAWAVDRDQDMNAQVRVEIGGEVFCHTREDLVQSVWVTKYTDSTANGVEKEICVSSI